MSLLRLVALLAATSLAACANVSPDPQPATDAGSIIRFDPGPGQFEYWRTSMYDQKSSRVSASLVQLKPHKDWGPIASACIHTTIGTDANFCIRMFVPNEHRQMLVFVEEFVGNEWRALKPPREFLRTDVHATVELAIDATNEGITFTANGQLLHRATGSSGYEAFSVGCSSAICRFRLPQ